MTSQGTFVFFNGSFMAKEEVRISPDDRGFLFADGVYEVIRSYGGKLFKAQSHLKRLKRSLAEIRMDTACVDDLERVALDLIERNGLKKGDAVVYIQVTRGAAPRGHAFPDGTTPPTLYVKAYPFVPPVEKLTRGIKAALVPDSRWARCDIKSVALLPNVLAFRQAEERGADEAIFVRNGVVTEGSHTSVCALFDGRLQTHPSSNRILSSVTRGVVLGLCRANGIPVDESPIPEKELLAADEIMILGTTPEIMPVVDVDGARIGDGTPGPVTRELQEKFRELT